MQISYSRISLTLCYSRWNSNVMSSITLYKVHKYLKRSLCLSLFPMIEMLICRYSLFQITCVFLCSIQLSLYTSAMSNYCCRSLFYPFNTVSSDYLKLSTSRLPFFWFLNVLQNLPLSYFSVETEWIWKAHILVWHHAIFNELISP